MRNPYPTRGLIGITGLRGHGKDTAAAALVKVGYVRLAFADALYTEVSLAFGITTDFLGNRDTKELPLPELALNNCTNKEFVAIVLEQDRIAAETSGAHLELKAQLTQPRSPRQIMQYWGTEYRRGVYGDSYWRDLVEAVLLANPTQNFVITDVRFPDEAKLLERIQGIIIRVVRPGAPGANDKSLLHSSEVAMLGYPVAATFTNLEGNSSKLGSDVVDYVTSPQLAA